ncbi:hypothetical protein GCM10023083_62330 [Streptomyces phyllanthi]
MAYDLITTGRSGADLYPPRTGATPHLNTPRTGATPHLNTPGTEAVSHPTKTMTAGTVL